MPVRLGSESLDGFNRNCRPPSSESAFGGLRRHAVVLLALAAFTAAINLPFASVHVPTARETGQHPWSEVVIHTPSFFDTFHVGYGNYVWGGLVSRFNHLVRPDIPAYSERTTGFPPLNLAYIWRRR